MLEYCCLSANGKKKRCPIYEEMSDLRFFACDCCKEAWSTMKVCAIDQLHICVRCNRDKSILRLFSQENNAIPGSVPDCLAHLSVVEEMLISQIMPIMQTYVLPFGQYGYRCYVVNLQQDMQSLATSLPRTAKSVGVVVVRWRIGKSSAQQRLSSQP